LHPDGVKRALSLVCWIESLLISINILTDQFTDFHSTFQPPGTMSSFCDIFPHLSLSLFSIPSPNPDHHTIHPPIRFPFPSRSRFHNTFTSFNPILLLPRCSKPQVKNASNPSVSPSTAALMPASLSTISLIANLSIPFPLGKTTYSLTPHRVLPRPSHSSSLGTNPTSPRVAKSQKMSRKNGVKTLVKSTSMKPLLKTAKTSMSSSPVLHASPYNKKTQSPPLLCPNWT
jgi:hypothetical protein